MNSSVTKFVVISDRCSVSGERRWCSASLRDHDIIWCRKLGKLRLLVANGSAIQYSSDGRVLSSIGRVIRRSITKTWGRRFHAVTTHNITKKVWRPKQLSTGD